MCHGPWPCLFARPQTAERGHPRQDPAVPWPRYPRGSGGNSKHQQLKYWSDRHGSGRCQNDLKEAFTGLHMPDTSRSNPIARKVGAGHCPHIEGGTGKGASA
jgi:hypothetical protein